MPAVMLDDHSRTTSPTKAPTPRKRISGHEPSPFNISKLKMKLGRTKSSDDLHYKAALKSPGFKARGIDSRPTSPERTTGSDIPAYNSRGNVLSRLQALFPSHQAHSNNSSCITSISSKPPTIPHPDIPRLEIPLPTDSSASPEPNKPGPPSLKIRIVTWNHGYSLPKGDLETLLGHVPPYDPPPANSDKTALPPFELNDLHPYHIIVIAGQECPSQSNMPLGLGAGFKMELRDRERKLERARSKKEKERAKLEVLDKLDSRRRSEEQPPEPDANSAPGEPPIAAANVPLVVLPPPPTPPPARSKVPSLHSLKSASTPNILMTSGTPLSTPQPVGWSMILEDWFVNGSQRMHDGKQVHLSSASAVALSPPFAPPTPYLNHQPPPLLSTHSTSFVTKSSGMVTPIRPPSPGSSHSSGNQPLSEGQDADVPIPPSRADNSKGQKGPYELLIKERLMGIYIAIFVHRDARHHVQGLSKSSVKAGLIGGRVGNKGGIGVSMKVAGVSLLFVNAHLAAHEGRSEARLANWAKIKAELNVDTFLKPHDPRNMAEDLTDRFDHSYLFGDLNFRLNVTRLHAEWLVSRKEYATALEFDQLRSAMRTSHAFDGFTEGAINFPPTFKYDVMRTLKKSRSVRAAIAGKASRRLRSSKVALAEENALSEADELDNRVSVSEDSDSDEGEHEGQSMLSSGRKSGYSKYTTDGDASDDSENEADDPLLPAAQNTIANLTLQQPGIQHKILSAPVTQKAKAKFMALVNHSGPLSPSRPTSPRPSSPTKASTEVRLPLPSVIVRAKSDLNPPTSPLFKTTHVNQEVVPGSPLLAKPVSIHRPHSTKSGSAKPKDTDDLPNDDGRGVYDSSSKQRVPSWCDRILFKSTVVPEPETKDIPKEARNLANRMSQLFTSHLKRTRRDSAVSSSSGEGSSNFHGDPAPPLLQPLPADRALLSPTPKDEIKSIPLSRLLGQQCNSAKTAAFERSVSLTMIPSPPTPSDQPATTVNGRRKSFSSPVIPVDSSGIPSVPPKLTTSPTFPLASNLRSGVISFAEALGTSSTPTPPNQTRKWYFPFLSTPQAKEPPAPLPPPRETHRKGDMVCINYNTLDDRQMRKLEGRSDHRPVIGSYAIYI